MLTVLIIYFVVLIALALMARTLARPAYRWLFTLLHGAWLTMLTLSCANTNPLFLAEEAGGLSFVGYLRQYLSNDDQKSYLPPSHNFILVDVSNDTQLLTIPQQRLNTEYPAIISGVDRKRLASFLNTISQDSTLLRATNLIVCDVLFDYPTDSVGATDLALMQSLTTLTSQRKLIVAESGQTSPTETAIRYEALHRGLIDIPLHDGLFFNFHLLDSTGRFSLPYRMYEQLQARRVRPWNVPGLGTWLEETSADGKSTSSARWGLNTFIPELRLTDADVEATEVELSDPLTPEPGSWLGKFLTQFGARTEEEPTIKRVSLPVYELGELLNRTDLLGNLLQPNSGRCTVIFIGSFRDTQRDIHPTTFGEMHGPLLLLNIYLNLLAGAHLLTGTFILFLFVMFCLVSYQMLRGKIDHQPDALSHMLDEWKHKLARWFTTPTDWFVSWKNRLLQMIPYSGLAHRFPRTTHFARELLRRITDVASLILEDVLLSKQPYWLLVAILAVSVLYFNHVINIMGLLIYLAAVDFSFQILKRPEKALPTNYAIKNPLASTEAAPTSTSVASIK